MVTLPSTPNRVDLRSFGLVASLGLAVAIAATARVAGFVLWPAYGAASGIVLGIWAWTRPGSVEKPLHLWNRLAGFMLRGARLLTTGICFAIISVAGRAGSRLCWSPDAADASGWEPRPLCQMTGGSPSTIGWIRAFVTWTWRSGNVWAGSLLPFLVLLRVLRTQQAGSLDDRIYTLF